MIFREDPADAATGTAVLEFQEAGGAEGIEFFIGNDDSDTGLRVNSTAVSRFWGRNLAFEGPLQRPGASAIHIAQTFVFGHVTFSDLNAVMISGGTCDDTTHLIRGESGAQLEIFDFWLEVTGSGCAPGAGGKSALLNIESWPTGWIRNGNLVVPNDADWRAFRVDGNDANVKLAVQDVDIISKGSTTLASALIHVTPAAGGTPSSLHFEDVRGLRWLDRSIENWGGITPTGRLTDDHEILDVFVNASHGATDPECYRLN
ncbi:MAG: hypothetical protein R3344_14460, partial [Acidobacteriota bacterium]|nr:hypothetical protein [Acidobacteriota bacterium]